MNLTKFFAAPIHAHDCEHCTWRGVIQPDGGSLTDVYTCEESVILRHGSSPPEYSSFPRQTAALVARDKPNSGFALALALIVRQEAG